MHQEKPEGKAGPQHQHVCPWRADVVKRPNFARRPLVIKETLCAFPRRSLVATAPRLASHPLRGTQFTEQV